MNLAISLLFLLVAELFVQASMIRYFANTGWSVWLITLVAVAMAILLRVILVFLPFVWASRYSAALRKVSTFVRAFWREFLACIWLFAVVQLFGFSKVRWVRRFTANSDNPADVIVLLHGFLCNQRIWTKFERSLEKTAAVVAVNVDPLFWNIENSAKQLAEHLRQIKESNPLSKIFVVGHSMGGVLARVFAQKNPGQIAGVLSIGSPHHGTEISVTVGGHQNGPVTPRTKWLQAFNEAAKNTKADDCVICVWSDCDNIVFPQTSSCLHRGHDHLLPGLGHLSLLTDGRAKKVIVSLIADMRKR
jgi:predicted alpha/beta hydrolase family esterase